MQDMIELGAVRKGAGREKLLGVKDVALWLGVSESWVRDHATGRNLPAVPAIKLGGLLKFRSEEIERWLKDLKIAA